MDIVIAGLLLITALLLISGRPLNIKIQHEHHYTGEREIAVPQEPFRTDEDEINDPDRPAVHLDAIIKELNDIMYGGDPDDGR